MDSILSRVHEIAREQLSVVSIDQMYGCGANRMWVSRRSADGIIVKVGPSAYRMGGVPPSFQNRAMAAVLSCKGLALASHRTALFLHGFEQVFEPMAIEITVPRHWRPRQRKGIRVHESAAFELTEPTIGQGVPVTGVARTILDCAPMFERPVRLLDDALRQRIVTWEELWRCSVAHDVAGRNERPFKEMLLQRDGRTPAGGEFASRMAELLISAGLPEPVFEHPVVVDGHRYYLDLAWPHRMVAVECNDAGSHDTPKAFRRDPMKRNRCERAGWLYKEFTWWDMVENPCEVVAIVGAAIEERAAA